MMDDTVTEIGGEYLTLHRLGDNKRNGFLGSVCACVDLVTQTEQVCLIKHFIRNGIRGTCFVPATIPISVFEAIVSNGDISLYVFHFQMKFRHRTHIVVVIPIVVVRVSVVDIHVPRTPRAFSSAINLLLTLNESTQTFSLRKLLTPESRNRRDTRLHTSCQSVRSAFAPRT